MERFRPKASTVEVLTKLAPELEEEGELDARGRPTKFRPEYVEKTKQLCAQGATNVELADFFKVSIPTIRNWQNRFPEFFIALQEGKQNCDLRVQRSLYEKAVGTYEDIPFMRLMPKLNKDGTVMRKKGKVQTEMREILVRTYFPPELGAQILWLKNRMPDDWRDKVQVENKVTVDDAARLLVQQLLMDAGLGVRKHLHFSTALEKLPVTIEGEKVGG